jgi:hypothetical protein
LVFGLKGRFYQPRPQAWDRGQFRIVGLKGRFTWVMTANGPFRVKTLSCAFSQAFGLG